MGDELASEDDTREWGRGGRCPAGGGGKAVRRGFGRERRCARAVGVCGSCEAGCCGIPLTPS